MSLPVRNWFTDFMVVLSLNLLRAHQQKIIPVVEEALRQANNQKRTHAVAFTRGPGLMGALLVGVSFAKSFAMGLDIPLIDVNHMHGHILAHFLQPSAQHPAEFKEVPSYPFLCLTVSGGHTQIVKVSSPFEHKYLGQTIDDAAGEAFDKTAKILGLPYPGGPLVDKHAKAGNPNRFKFPIPHSEGLNFSFSGLKTAILYFVRDEKVKDAEFVEKNLDDICASVQKTIVEILMKKVNLAIEQTGITEIAIAGGVSANSGLRNAILSLQEKGCNVYIPAFEYCTDNAAMIAIAGYYKYLRKEFAGLDVTPVARY
jgi:N6-L-threonylcarbamoyladenine synthase